MITRDHSFIHALKNFTIDELAETISKTALVYKIDALGILEFSCRLPVGISRLDFFMRTQSFLFLFFCFQPVNRKWGLLNGIKKENLRYSSICFLS